MPERQAQQQQQGISWSSMILQAGLIYLCFSYMNPFRNVPAEEAVIDTADVENSVAETEPLTTSSGDQIPNANPNQVREPVKQGNYRNLFAQGTELVGLLFSSIYCLTVAY